MKAAALVRPETFTFFEVELPEPKESEIQLLVKACGVCTSELHVWADKANNFEKPLFMGHEVSGVITKLGANVSDFAIGDRVVVYAQNGFSEYVCVPETYAIKLSERIPFKLALGEPIACAVNATKRSNIQVGDTVVIIGLGFMGALILQGAKLKGAATVIVIDKREESLAVAKNLGANLVWNADEDKLKEKVMKATNGIGADVVIEATGYQQPLDLATELVRIRGTLVILGYHQGGERTVNMQMWNWKGLDVVNAHERDPLVYMEGMRTGIKLLELEQLNMDSLVTHSFSLEKINEAFTASFEKPPSFMKAVIVTE